MYPTPCHCFLCFSSDFFNNFSFYLFLFIIWDIIWFHFYEIVYEYHSTSIALSKTSWISFHINILFEFPEVSIASPCQWFLSLPSLNTNQLNWSRMFLITVLIPNESHFEWQTTSIALSKISWISLHSMVSPFLHINLIFASIYKVLGSFVSYSMPLFLMFFKWLL